MELQRERSVSAWHRHYLGLHFGKWFLLCFFALLSIFAFFLVVIENPLLDQDSPRYIDGSLSYLSGWHFGLIPWHGTVLPLFINYWPARLFRYEGVVLFNSLVVSYGLAHLFMSLTNALRVRSRGAFLAVYLTFVIFLSFTPIVTMTIASESITLGVFALVLSILISKRCALTDLAILAIFSGYHTSNLIILAALVIGLLVWSLFRERGYAILLSLMVTCLFTSRGIDRLLIQRYGEGRTRLEAAFVGAILLNYYPFVLEQMCEERPKLRICRPQTREFIERKRAPDVYQPGRFLWAGDKLYILPSKDPTAPEMYDVQRDWPVISISEFEESSKMLTLTAIRIIPQRWRDYLSITARRIAALYWQNKIVNYNYVKNRNLDLSHGPLHFILEEDGLFDFYSKAMKLLYPTVIPFLLGLSALLPDARQNKAALLRICALGAALYLSNIMVMGTLGTAVSRYHYRAFFIPAILLLCLLWHVTEVATSRKNRP